ncbi:SusC/RagA family TonB-linked outer membrane protein [Chitinophaga arvensicola]|uniref:TonB-linked outer membrane protein, SusC/RagA family n=1 Tax=Chitinophaga arvensicola TaxID=29529 RepID=A0A1I0SD40_9BACT|nr:TonB-dependent receptor [Chitinophaga arvensicola]SEW53849.1 TonB-linked outer membrane protein, SusC/RagA family [Chitinophaga arvensicola]
MKKRVLFIYGIAMLLTFAASAQQAGKTTGQVKSGKGEQLPGINIQVKHSGKGTVTDAQGRFTIAVSPNDTLLLSGIGYKKQTVPVNGRDFLELRLQDDETALGEVVVVGYGTQKKSDLTNAVAQIKGADITRRPVSNIQQALQGLAPGVTVLDRGGAPGVSNATIRVRGITTFNINSSSTSGYDLGKNDALVIVDGIEQRMQDINPEDIESLSVLKDAASTAIYGSRATNGVILITTKRAKAGKVTVNYNGYYAWQKSVNKPEMMDIESYMREQVVAYTNAGVAVPARFSETSIQQYVNATDRLKYPMPNTWFNTMLKTAPQQSHTLSVAGGNEVVKTRMSVRYQDQQGIVNNYSDNLSEVRLNADYTPLNSRVHIGGDINYRNNSNQKPTVEPFNNMFHGSLWAVPKYPDGTYGLSTQGNNPLMFDEIGGLSKQGIDYFTGSVKGDVELLKGLRFSTQLGARIMYTQQKNFTNAYTNTDKNTNITKTVTNNSLTEVRNTLKEYTWNNLLTYDRTFGKHDLKALAGYSQIDNKQTFLSAYRERFYNNDITSIGQGANDGTKSNSGSDAEYGLRSYFGRINYAYAGKYLLEVNGRYDGSSRFAGDKRYSFFPSFSAGWRIAQEQFFAPLQHIVNDLKLRGSYGKTGNQSVDLYSYYDALTATSYTFNGVPVAGYRQTTLANTDLGWESTTQLDLGLDASFLDRRLNVTADYYRKLTSDILLNLDIPATVGLNAPPQNAGSVENKGLEITVNYSSKQTGNFRYNIGANFSLNENMVTDLKGTGPYITGSDIDPRYIIKKGLPINTLWGYQTDGLFQTADEISKYPTLASNTRPGDVKYVDRNGDGKIDANDMTNIGLSFPKYTFGLNAGFQYKEFELNLLIQGAAKVDTRLSGALAEMGNQEGFTHEIYANNYWTPEHTDARFPRPIKYDLRNVATSDRLVIDGSYLRLKNIQLAYHLPEAISKRALISRSTVYVSATNLLTFSKLNEWNLDPEAESGRAVYYPQTSLFTVGLNLQF